MAFLALGSLHLNQLLLLDVFILLYECGVSQSEF